MINPAAIFRVVGFLNKEDSKTYNTPQEGNLVLCYSDRGTPVIIELKSNKKDMTLDDVKAFLDNKRDSVVRKKDIETLANDLNYSDDFIEELFEAEANFVKSNPEAKPKEIMIFKRDYATQKAKDIIVDNKTVNKDSVLKFAISTPNKKRFFNLGKIEIPIIDSRSLMFKDDEPQTSGFYYYSQNKNSLPISISAIFNKEGNATGFFKVTLSKLANLDQFNFLAGHIKRTILRQIEKEEKIYINIPEFDYQEIKSKESVLSILTSMRNGLKIADVITEEMARNYLSLFDTLLAEVNNNPKLILSINLSFNMVLKTEELRKIVEEKPNPFTNLTNTIVNLNCSKENPETKNQLKLVAKSKIDDILDAKSKGIILATYFIPPEKVGEEPDSWGFMANNIQRESFVLSSLDSFSLFNEVQKSLSNIKSYS